MVDIKAMLPHQLEEWLKEMGQPSFRARQIFQWLHRGVTRFDDMETSTVFNLVFRVIVRELRPFIAAYMKSAQEVA